MNVDNVSIMINDSQRLQTAITKTQDAYRALEAAYAELALSEEYGQSEVVRQLADLRYSARGLAATLRQRGKDHDRKLASELKAV